MHFKLEGGAGAVDVYYSPLALSGLPAKLGGFCWGRVFLICCQVSLVAVRCEEPSTTICWALGGKAARLLAMPTAGESVESSFRNRCDRAAFLRPAPTEARYAPVATPAYLRSDCPNPSTQQGAVV